MQSVVGCKSHILVSDPWDFCSECGSGPFHAVVDRVRQGTLLVRLDSPVSYHGARLEYLVVSPRYAGGIEQSLLAGQVVPVGMTWIDGTGVSEKDPFDLSWWRGGPAFLGSFRLLPSDL